MSKSINVYWSTVSTRNDIDWQISMEQPISLQKELFNNKNKSNKTRQSFLRCPAVRSAIKNTLVWRAPKNTSVDIEVENDMIKMGSRYNEQEMFPWVIEHVPTISNNILITFDYRIIFFAEEDVDVLFTAPYFSESPHLQYGAIIPGKFNVGSWFRPYNAEMNLWSGNKHIEFKENEAIAYFTFLTDKNIVAKRFKMNDDLIKISKSMSTSSTWLPNKTLEERYKIFKNRGMKKVILNNIKDNLI